MASCADGRFSMASFALTKFVMLGLNASFSASIACCLLIVLESASWSGHHAGLRSYGLLTVVYPTTAVQYIGLSARKKMHEQHLSGIFLMPVSSRIILYPLVIAFIISRYPTCPQDPPSCTQEPAPSYNHSSWTRC